VTAADVELPPWLAVLSPETREAVQRNVEAAPPLSDRQRARLQQLFRAGGAA
jgi:hypothetical protein